MLQMRKLSLRGEVCPILHMQELTVDFPGGSAIKNPPAMQELQETQIQSLSQEAPLEEGMATHSSILAWRILYRVAWWATVHAVPKSQMCLSD